MIGIKQKVENILKDSEQTRNDDNMLLCSYYFRHYSYNIFKLIESNGVSVQRELYKFFKEITPPEDVIRVRRKLNQEGKYLATDENIKRKRFQREQDVRKDLGYNPEMSQPIKS